MWAAIFGQPHNIEFAPTPEEELRKVLMRCPLGDGVGDAVAEQAAGVRAGGYPCARVPVPATGAGGAATVRPPLRRAQAYEHRGAASVAGLPNVRMLALSDGGSDGAASGR